MKTSRIKNIIIVLLLIVNAFLLTLLLSRRAEERDAYERSVEQLVTLYESAGVTLDPALLMQEESLLSATPGRDTARETAFAEALLGEDVRVSDSGGGVYRYANALGYCSVRAGGSVEGSLSRSVDDPQEFCRALFHSFGYVLTDTTLTDEGSGSITGLRSTGSVPVFNALLTLTFSRGTLTGVSGIFLSSLTEGGRTEGIDAITALVRLLDHRSASGLVWTEIESIESGYLLQSSAATPLRLLPVWRIGTDVNDFYVNCKTGEITRE